MRQVKKFHKGLGQEITTFEPEPKQEQDAAPPVQAKDNPPAEVKRAAQPRSLMRSYAVWMFGAVLFANILSVPIGYLMILELQQLFSHR